MNENQIPGKSFIVAIEQIAQLLRSEVKAKEQKLKKREARLLSKAARAGSLSNTVERIAKLLRTELTDSPKKPTKKRKWSRQALSPKKVTSLPLEKPLKKRRAG